MASSGSGSRWPVKTISVSEASSGAEAPFDSCLEPSPNLCPESCADLSGSCAGASGGSGDLSARVGSNATSTPAHADSPSLLSTHSFARFKKGVWEKFDDIVTPEEPYSIAWRNSASGSVGECNTKKSGQGEEAQGICPALAEQRRDSSSGEAVLWAYPHDIEPLVVGHVLLDLCPSERCLSRSVSLTVEAPAPTPSLTQTFAENGTQGAVGTCVGMGSAEKLYVVTIGGSQGGPIPQPPAHWQSKDVLKAMDAFIEAEGLWESTGCFHRAGVYAIERGSLLMRSEDIGRHNCVDRLAGWSVLHDIPLSDKALLISARMTSSLCAKTIRAGFPVIVSRSAVTTAAIAMAREAGVTLIGFARTQEQRFTVFNQGKCGIYDE